MDSNTRNARNLRDISGRAGVKSRAGIAVPRQGRPMTATTTWSLVWSSGVGRDKPVPYGLPVAGLKPRRGGACPRPRRMLSLRRKTGRDNAARRLARARKGAHSPSGPTPHRPRTPRLAAALRATFAAQTPGSVPYGLPVAGRRPRRGGACPRPRRTLSLRRKTRRGGLAVGYSLQRTPAWNRRPAWVAPTMCSIVLLPSTL